MSRHLTALVRPGTKLIEVSMNWTAGPDGPAIVNEVVDNALEAAPPGQLGRVNLAIASGASARQAIAPVRCALITLVAALAFLLLFFGPRPPWKARPYPPPDGAE